MLIAVNALYKFTNYTSRVIKDKRQIATYFSTYIRINRNKYTLLKFKIISTPSILKWPSPGFGLRLLALGLNTSVETVHLTQVSMFLIGRQGYYSFNTSMRVNMTITLLSVAAPSFNLLLLGFLIAGTRLILLSCLLAFNGTS